MIAPLKAQGVEAFASRQRATSLSRAPSPLSSPRNPLSFYLPTVASVEWIQPPSAESEQKACTALLDHSLNRSYEPTFSINEFVKQLLLAHYGEDPLFQQIFDSSQEAISLRMRLFSPMRLTARESRCIFERLSSSELSELLETDRTFFTQWLLNRTDEIGGNFPAPLKVTSHRAVGHIIFYLQLLIYWRGTTPIELQPTRIATRYQFGIGRGNLQAAHHAFLPNIRDPMMESGMPQLLEKLYLEYKSCSDEASCKAWLEQRADTFIWFESLGSLYKTY